MCALDFVENCFQSLNNQISFTISDFDENFSEEEVLEQLLNLLKKKLKISIINWQPSHKEYPSYMFLGGDRGILAYVDFKYIQSEENFSDSNIVCDSQLILKTLRAADSQLDRPVFFVYMLNCRDKQGIYFETNEQIKDRWFRNLYSSKYYAPVVDEMGDFNNLIALWTDLKKNNVKV
ncbi:MAG: hypothetical protein IJ300_09215 [Clostridia bacterium]|nr:hypothetical protein [Clostridia bacterium]